MKLHETVTSKRISKTFDGLLARFTDTHGDKYSYTKVIYRHSTIKITIVCPKHGEFTQLASEHARGRGCKLCARDTATKKITGNTEVFTKKAATKHNSKYTYGKVNYINSKTKVTITCPVHGDFEQTPDLHLKGHGCTGCGHAARAQVQIKNKDEFVVVANAVHNYRYNYTHTVYKNDKEKVIIICPSHGSFMQVPNSHKQGKGCPKCAISGFKTDKPGMLYYFKITNGVNTAWKIGITNLSLRKRYTSAELRRTSSVVAVWYASGQEAYNEEQRILKKYKQYKYTGPALLTHSGNTELFNVDILNLSRSTTASTEPVEEPTESEPTEATFDIVDEVNLDD